MLRSPKLTMAIVVVALVAGGAFLVAPASADMHAACDRFAGQDAGELPFGPTGYGNVELLNNRHDANLTYQGQLYCPGAEFRNITLNMTNATEGGVGQSPEVATTSRSPCEATVTEPCTISGTTTLAPGTYWVVMVFDVDDPEEKRETGTEPEYQDVVRKQRFEWTGRGQPVVTCPDAGYVHFNPTCPAVVP